MTVDSNGTTAKFLPTPSARRATLWDRRCTISGTISTHALREEGDASALRQGRPYLISTHALREEGDCRVPDWWSSSTRFLPTPSARRATAPGLLRDRRGQISTHALREEGDTARAAQKLQQTVFLPTPSARRATQKRWLHILKLPKFLPTPSARRATSDACKPRRDGRPISTHALREEGDQTSLPSSRATKRFLPTPSARRAPLTRLVVYTADVVFLPTPSARRATRYCRATQSVVTYFYPRPPRGGRRQAGCGL